MRAIYHDDRVYFDAEEFLTTNLDHIRDVAAREPEDTNPALVQFVNTVWIMARLGRWMIQGGYAPCATVEEWLQHHFPGRPERFFVLHLRKALTCDESEVYGFVEDAITLHPIAQDDMKRVLA